VRWSQNIGRGLIYVTGYIYTSTNTNYRKGAQHFKTPIYIMPSRASKSAIEAIETAGGKIVCKYYNRLSLRDCIKGRTDRISAAPTRREDISKLSQVCCSSVSSPLSFPAWYGTYRNRGYISHSTLSSLGNLPFVEERWKHLATQLGVWKKQGHNVQTKS
jgi:large subunit ribosomal protein L15